MLFSLIIHSRENIPNLAKKRHSREELDVMENELESLTWFLEGAKKYIKSNLKAALDFSEDSDAQTEKMFMFITLMFWITNVPFAIVETANLFSTDPYPNPHAESLSILLFVLGFNTNPILLYYANVWFRETVNNAICSPVTDRKWTTINTC